MSKALLVVDMPEHCEDCDLFEANQMTRYVPYCYKANRVTNWKGRPKWCPLVPAPDHYQLEYWEKDAYKGGWNDALDQIGLYERPHYLDALEGKENE